MIEVVEVNLEWKMPTVPQARIRLDQALRDARSQKKTVLKLIHGYGSTGKGGKIKQDVQVYLKEQQRLGRIRYYVKGEDFDPFSDSARQMLQAVPKLYKDPDYSRGNGGITMVVL